MNIRPKTVRRLMILFAVLAVFAGAIVLLILRATRRQKAEVAGMRESALKAYRMHDYAVATAQFNAYLTRSHTENTDAEAVFDYADSRANTPYEGNRQVYDAIGLLQHYLDLDPADSRDASHKLLKLYLQARYHKEARTLAAKLLSRNPRDVEALRGQVQALDGENNPSDALAAVQKLNAVDPENLTWQLTELRLMAEAKRPNEGIVAHARQLLDAHPDDPRFLTLLAVAEESSGDSAGAMKLFEAAAKRPPVDPDSVIEIIAKLDDASRFDLSDDLLARAVAAGNDPRLQAIAMQRLFERQQFGALAERLKQLDPASAQSPTGLLAYKAMALFETSHRPEAEAVVAALATRKDDASVAWTEALRTRYAAKPADPAVQIKTYVDAILHDRWNPVLDFFLADARAALGETDEAIREWTLAARKSRTWGTPLYRISRALSNTGRYSAAMQAARLLNRRAPDAPATQVAYVVAEWGLISKNPAELKSATGDKLLKIVERIRAKMPAETDTLPVYVALLSRRGDRDKAIEVAKAALAADPPPPESVLGQLATVSEQEHLDLDSYILDRAEKTRGMSPAVAFARALTLVHAGHKPEAMTLIETLRQSHPNDPVWMLGEARFREAIADPDTLKTWVTLCDANPGNIQVQYQALASPVRFSDRDFWRRTIDRVKALTGPDAQAWQIEDARWQLSGQPSAADVDKVVASLQKIVRGAPELADVHRLLAQALLKTGRPEGPSSAIAELTVAHELQPEDFSTTAELVPLLVSQGNRDAAMALVDTVCASPGLSTDRRLWAAQTYAELGNTDAALALLTTDNARQRDSGTEALLAGLYVRSGRLDDASALYLKLLDDPAAGPNALAAGASFFAASGKPDQADRFVERLQKANLSPGALEILKAHLFEMQGKRQEAAQVLTDASKAHSGAEQVWIELAGLYLRNGKIDMAEKVVADGVGAIPSAPKLSAMRQEIALMRPLGPQDVGPLLAPLSHDPQQPAADQAMKILSDAAAHHTGASEVIAALRQLSDKYSNFLPLQEVLVQRYLRSRQFKEAADVASRAAEVLPNDPEPLKLLCNVQMAAGDWEAARTAALRWRKASLANPLEPDVNIAQTYLQQPNPDPAAALKQLDPYMGDDAPLQRKLAATPPYCRALIMSGRSDDAAARLEPLLAKSPQWTSVWLDLGSNAQPNADAAMAWLKRLAQVVKPEAAPQQLAMAAAWEQVGLKFDSNAAHEAARDLLQPLVAKPDAPAAAWWYWAMISQSLANLPEADRAWQEYLKLNSANAEARNNYAFVLLLEGGANRLTRAEQLATEAIAASPNISTFYDTLGRIQSQQGRKPEAVKNFRLALDKDPNDVEAMIGLADMLQAQPEGRDEARSLLTRINTIVEGGTPLAPSIRKELDRVKSALSASI